MIAWPLTPDGRLLVLRTCRADMTSHGGYQWPDVGGTATAPDWDPDPDRTCGGGLHGLLWGCGDGGLLDRSEGARWLVVAVDPEDVANIDQPARVRFRSAAVVYSGDRDGALAFLDAEGAGQLPVVFAARTAGDCGTATAGHYGTATAGDYGTVVLSWRDGRKRVVVAYVGEGGIKPDTPYRLDPVTHEPVEVTS